MSAPIEPAVASDPQGRVARKRAERRRLVEQTAAEVFAERGYDGANFEQIAARLNMRGASLYHYYTSKEELFLATVENATNDVLLRLRTIAESDVAPEERLRRLFVEQALMEIRDYPACAPLLFMSVSVPTVAKRMAELRQIHGNVFRSQAHQVASRHGVSRHRANMSVLLALGSLSYLRTWYDPDGPLELQELAELVGERLLQPFLRAEA